MQNDFKSRNCSEKQKGREKHTHMYVLTYVGYLYEDMRALIHENINIRI